MISLKTVTMQLINGEPDGIRICRVEGESLVTVVVPREKLGEAKTLPELPHRGIYYLLDEDHGTLSRVYAGQTTQGFARLDDHKARKNFWNRAVMFLDDENNIDRDSLDALEAKAIEYVRTHGAYETDNSNTPSPHISPYREQTVEKLHSRILFRMQVLGYDLDRVDKGPVGVESIFHTTRRGISARGQFDKTTGKLTVLAGSQIDLDHPVLKNASATRARRDLFGEDTGLAILKHDESFSSPSTAATFVLGGSQNGWIQWTNDTGQTLDCVYRRAE